LKTQVDLQKARMDTWDESMKIRKDAAALHKIALDAAIIRIGALEAADKARAEKDQ